MTRKRYVKLTMAQGHQRNQAQELAKDGPGQGIPYQTLYRARLCRFPVLLFSKQFTDAIRQACKAAAQLGAAMREINARANASLRDNAAAIMAGYNNTTGGSDLK